MNSAVSLLPDQQLALLNDAYRKAVARKRLRMTAATAVFFGVLVISAIGAEVNLGTFVSKIGNFASYFDRIATLEGGARVWSDIGEWFWGWKKWLALLGETILISYVGTLAGALLAFALNFLAAENTSPAPWLQFTVRRLMEFCRTVPDIVFALIFVIAFGLGPMAGVLAIMIHSVGALGKLYSEMVENVDMKPVEGVRSTGANWISCMRFAVCAAGGGGLCQLHAAALRNQCARRLCHGLRRRRRHRPGARGCRQEILLFRRQRDPFDDHRHRLHHRYRHRLGARTVVRQGSTGMTRLPAPDSGDLRSRYPEIFNRPASSRLAVPAMIAVALGIFAFGLFQLEFSPSRMLSGLNQLGWIVMLMIPPDPGSSLPAYLVAMGETLSIAMLGTTLAAVFALPVSLLAARNIVPSNIFRFPVRRFLDSIRGVDTLIWALVWINVVGLGPFAGVLAIAVSDFGAFGKLFSEAIEGADKKQVEGIRASGGSALHEIRFGLMPQVLPVIAGQVLYFIESNTRSATIIGIVGAGGIGLQLAEQIRVLEWQKVSFLILMILVAVAAIDWISGKLRFAIIGKRAVV